MNDVREQPSKKPNPIAPPAPPVLRKPDLRPDLPKGIPVSFLRFVSPAMQVVGRQSGDTLKAETLANGRRWQIEFIPDLRCFLVTFMDPTKPAAEHELVMEAQVRTWKP